MKELMTTLEDLKDLQQLLDAGADMIVISPEGLSSTSAQKLTKEEMEQAASVIREHGRKVGVQANLTLHEGMLDEADAMMAFLASMDVDAVFFADPSLYMMAKKYGIVDRLIYDPETLMTSINDAAWWLARNVRGISISPLLTLQETEEIAAAGHKAVVTVHGRTLMSRSYRKLLSSYKENFHLEEELAGKKSLSIIETKREEDMPIYEDETGTLIYSDNVLDSFDFIGKVLESQPEGLLITGSYISIEAQAEAVRAYRMIIDGADPAAVGKEYREKFSSERLDSGYYEQKTVK